MLLGGISYIMVGRRRKLLLWKEHIIEELKSIMEKFAVSGWGFNICSGTTIARRKI